MQQISKQMYWTQIELLIYFDLFPSWLKKTNEYLNVNLLI